jgi:hypothetical protein
MIDLSLAGLLGAVVGIVVAAIVYAPLVALIERGFRSRGEPQTAEQRETFGQEIGLLRRAALAVDIIAFSAIGYWVGKTIGD